MNDKLIIVTSGAKNAYRPDIKKITENKLLSVLTDMVNGKGSANFVLFTPQPDKIMTRLLKELVYIEAGGGLVSNERGQYLFIFRHGKWDLPKGKLEKGEQAAEGSIREVEEECNVTVKNINGALEPTWHAYAMKGKVVLKKTYWFLMETNDYGKMKPQTEEGITELKWFLPAELDEVRENTYGLIREITETIQPVK